MMYEMEIEFDAEGVYDCWGEEEGTWGNFWICC